MPGREWTVENGRPRRSLVVLANASIQAATTLQGLPLCAAFDGSPAHVALRRVPKAGSPISRGVGLVVMQHLFRGAT
jgi:hypothetical protein